MALGIQTGVSAINASVQQANASSQTSEAQRTQQNGGQRRAEEAQQVQKVGQQPLAKEGALGTKINVTA